MMRAGGLFRDPSGFIAPADCWGDVGAASGPLFLVLSRRRPARGTPRAGAGGVHEFRVRRAVRVRGRLGPPGGAAMGLTIKVNGSNSVVHKGSSTSSATIPDVCKTPSPAARSRSPTRNMARSATWRRGPRRSRWTVGNGGVKGSEFSSNGDEAGTAGGVKSSTFIKEATWILYSFDVKMDGKNACRLTRQDDHNHQNTRQHGGSGSVSGRCGRDGGEA